MENWLEFARKNLPEELPEGLPLSQVLFRTLIRDMSAGHPGYEMDAEESIRLRRMAHAWIMTYMLHVVQPEKYPRERPHQEFQQILPHQHDGIPKDSRDEYGGYEKGELR